MARQLMREPEISEKHIALEGEEDLQATNVTVGDSVNNLIEDRFTLKVDRNTF